MMKLRRLVTTVLVIPSFLLTAGCDNQSVLVARDASPAHGVTVQIYDEGIKLSTRHVRLELGNPTEQPQPLSFSLTVLARDDALAALDLTLGFDNDPAWKTVRSRPEGLRALMSRTADDFVLPAGQRATYYINTDLPGAIAPDQVHIRWRD